MTDAPTAPPQLEVRYALPPFFHEIPVLGEPEVIAEELYATARELLPQGDAEEWVRWAVMAASGLDDLRAVRAVYAGFCLLDMEGRNSTATVVVSHTALEAPGTPARTVARTAGSLSAAYRDAEIHELSLPAGPAVAKIEGRTTPVEQGEIPMGSIQVFVPLPNELEMLTLEMTTPHLRDWDFYSRMFSDTVNSIEWWEE
ncbi:MAG: hypothetical protein ACRDP3_20705 [Streptomyces sp.]|uniref:hypothetical protein n=1 Tax=Streptomyces sp. TaxID=1931 RepID=UPI003D6BCA81